MGWPIRYSSGMSSKNLNLSVGCVLLFLAPFAAIGAFMAVLAVQRAADGNWKEAFYFALFGLTFGGFGVAGIAAVLAGRRGVQARAVVETRHPDAPWMWRPDWASGRILDASRTTMFATWGFAIFWNLISIPSAVMGVRAAIRQGETAPLLVLLFPLVGMGLMVWAVRSTLRYWKYGISRLELSAVPGVIGRSLIGTVRAPAALRPDAGFQVSLTCIRRVSSGGGKHRSSSENILWQEEQSIAGEPRRSHEAMETHIPIAFRLPADAVACSDSDPNNRVLWRLQVSAVVPGVDYESQFEVPVFRTPASDQPLSPDEERLTQIAQGAEYQQPADSRIVVTTSRRGTEIVFSAARNPGAATSLTLFLFLWIGCIALQMYFRAPLVFPIVTGLFGLLIALGVLDLWLGVSRVSADTGRLSWASGYLVPGRERSIAASEVADVIPTIGMQAGKTVYHDVTVVRKNGKKIKVGRSLRDKREADWLAGVIKRAIA